MNAKKIFFKTMALTLMATTAFSVVGCKDDKPSGGGSTTKTNMETRPLVMSISTPDGVFNPFFSTSAYDSSILGMTQIGMLGNDKKGNLVWGYDEPVVTLDYRTVYDEVKDQTTYEFILKNGIKFSDGQPLTIKDVLFNLYTYLDPAYTGSATMYSTDIVGLNAYRTQNPNATDTGAATFEEGFYDDAKLRMQKVVDYVKINGRGIASDDKPDAYWNESEVEGIKADYQTVAVEFKKELESDWNTAVESMESYKDWKFTAPWQIFLLNDGGFTELLLMEEGTGKYVKDDDGNYFLSEKDAADYQAELDEYLAEHSSMDEKEATKEWAINYVYEGFFPGTLEETNANDFETVLSYWGTSDTIRDKFAAEAKSAYFAKYEETGLIVPTISGIDGTKKTKKDFKGKDLGAEHEMLRITINGIDPKAQYNFAFTVAPLHYYSTTNYNGVDYINDFGGKGHFGLKYGDLDFMTNVINAPEKVGLPVGAGLYKASNASGKGTVTASNFFDKNIVYYERNEYFETLGDGTKKAEVHNAFIKYVRYKVVETDQIINAIANGDIDFGDPNATQENIAALDAEGIKHVEIDTSGYGYVGINPRFIPDVVIRRAIMKAMNTDIIVNNYYKGGLASIIYRPMSKTNWAYPEEATTYVSETGVSYEYDALGNDIEKMVVDAGYQKNGNGIYTKELQGFGTVVCDYTFTIAGASQDHPATAMFYKAASILNAHGFKIKVVTSQTALSDLSTGKLTVWAAAWGSAIDPDMYQIYHKDSKATSVNNWGYKQIKAKFNTPAYADEYAIINELSELIDAGRETDVQADREQIYALALDKVMELAVEFPTYQRKDMSAYNKKLLDESTMTPASERTPYNGLLSKMWQLKYN